MRQGDRVGERLVGVDLRGRLPDAAELEQVDHAPVARLQHRLAVAGRLGGGDHLAGDGQPLVGVVRGPQRDAVGVQRGRERGGIVRAPRLLDGEGAELAGAGGVGVVQLDRQPGEQPRGRRQITGRRGRERLLEQAHGRGVGGGDDDRHPAVAERRPGEQLRGRPRRGRARRPRRTRRGPAPRRPARSWAWPSASSTSPRSASAAPARAASAAS